MKKFIPNEGKILIKPLESEAKSKGGILLPAAERKILNCGTVIAVGAYPEGTQVFYKKDHLVYYGHNSGMEFSFEGEDYLIMRTLEIIGHVEEEEN
jgi:chaperonin GroES